MKCSYEKKGYAIEFAPRNRAEGPNAFKTGQIKFVRITVIADDDGDDDDNFCDKYNDEEEDGGRGSGTVATQFAISITVIFLLYCV